METIKDKMSGRGINGQPTPIRPAFEKPTMTRDQLVKKIEEELTCAICLSKFTEPKVLPCLHTYCKECIEGLVAKSPKTTTTVVCPQCRVEHSLPKGGAGKLLTSFSFTNMIKVLEVHKADESSSDALTCENGLDDNPATARCVNCDVYLCDSCSEMHKKMVATREHNITSLEEIKRMGNRSLKTVHCCPNHSKELLKLYCRTCSKTICGDCTYVDHRSHEYVFIDDVQDELKAKLSEKLLAMNKLAAEATHKKEDAVKEMSAHESNVAAIHARVDIVFAELIESFKKRQAEIHEEIEAQAKSANKSISVYVDEAELALASVTSNVSFVERLLESSDACEVASMASITLEQCKKLESSGPNITAVKSRAWELNGVEDSQKLSGQITVQLEMAPNDDNFDIYFTEHWSCESDDDYEY